MENGQRKKTEIATATVDHVIMLRIAVALERIADAVEVKQSQKITIFPWSKLQARYRMLLSSEAKDDFPQHAWPWTCDALMDIGATNIKSYRNIGDGCISAIARLMNECGYEDWKAT